MTETLNKIIKGDKVIILLVIALMIISSLLMGSTLSSLAIRNSNFSFYYLFKQLFFSLFAFVIMIFTSQIPYQIFSKLAKPILLAVLALLVITLIAGKSINSAKRWLEIPFIGLTIQTSDFVRIALIIYVAQIMSHYNPSNGDFNDMMNKVLYWSLPVIVLIAVNDFSTAFLLATTVFILIIFSPINLKLYFKKTGIVIAVGLLLIILAMALKIGRAETWLNRLHETKTEKIYGQRTQSLIAVSKAPIIPKPGSSTQKYLLANSYSDYVFAIAVEEYGYIGAIVIIVLYLILLKRIYLIIKKQKRTFPMYLSLGLAINILTQAFLHILVNVGIIPVTGQPLPFISMGGSSTISAAIQFGILLNISANNKKEEKQKTNQEEKQEPEIVIDDYPFLVG